MQATKIMTAGEIRDLLYKHSHEIAFIIGNGVNRYSNDSGILSWEKLLLDLWEKVTCDRRTCIPKGISLTEFYDILDLEKKENTDIQLEVKNLMSDWKPLEHHKQIVQKIKEFEAPLLTTNFDDTFVKTLGFELKRTETEGFTDYYPWSIYYSDTDLPLPTDGFGIWHINGMIKYRRSIRLGLSHYMGSVERARGMIHKKSENNLFSCKDGSAWQGCKTWLHIIFNKPLFIFGLELDENEIFLRWLLIERMKYFKKFPKRAYPGGWFLKTGSSPTDEGKNLFLKKTGFSIIEASSYDDIYSNIWK